MTDFLQYCNQLSKLEKDATDELLNKIKSRTYQKGEYLLKKREICKYLFFINDGLVKTFFHKNDKEFIMQFFPENAMFTVLNSYVNQARSSYMIIALESTSVTYIQHKEMEELCKKYHCIETFFRKLVSLASVNMMKRISEMLEENATEHYNSFVKENDGLLQRISLGDLSCYLGITQVSLSRIRAKK